MTLKNILAFLLAAVVIIFVIYTFLNRNKEFRLQFPQKNRQNTETKRLQTETVHTMRVSADVQRLMDSEGHVPGKPSYAPVAEIPTSSTNFDIRSVKKGTFFGCIEQSKLRSMLKYFSREDKSKFESLLNKGIVSGECTSFRPYEQVVLEETDTDKGQVRLSRIGENESYWTVIEAIK